jgi:selenocysteine lyase/cysteine desulfurase
VDGAHGVGHLEMDLGKLDPDFIVSNCHKYVPLSSCIPLRPLRPSPPLSSIRRYTYLYRNDRWLHVPRGTAIFHVPLRNQSLIRSTLPTSHGFEPRNSSIASPFPAFTGTSKTPYTAMFDFVGTIDNSPYLCVPAALKWRENLGGEEVIRKYCQDLAQAGGKLAAQELGTEVLENSTGTLGKCALVNVRLPIDVAKAKAFAAQAGMEEADVWAGVRDWFAKTLIDEYGTFIQSLYFGDAWWARLSGQVYLDMQDMAWAAETLKKICERINKGEWVGKESKL